MKVLIAGGGIAGLATALSLHRAGIDVEVFERSPEVRELGVGINMLPHAVRELAGLGLLDALERDGVRTRELILANRFGQPVWNELRGLDAGYDVPQISIHRGRLLGILHEAFLERIGERRLNTAAAVTGFENRDEAVAVRVEGRDGAAEWIGDLLIGADGIHSAVRSQLYPQEGPPVWSGIMLWRGTTPWPLWLDGRTMAIAGGNFAKFVFYPIGEIPGRRDMRLTNWAIMARTGGYGETPRRSADWTRAGLMPEVLEFVRDRFRLDFVDPVQLIEATEALYEYPNCDRDPIDRWSFGRVTLLGDAAHPMYPVGSNGASQAILDARSLAGHLSTVADPVAALAAYDNERRPATAAIVLANRKGGPEGVIDMVEARAPDGFDDIEAVASYAEREAVVRGYASLAGFGREKGQG
ncbi:MAG TPA: flavin-dependent oxidoreductase [Mesorhizobium sp.]|jgi:2-polyprenyl-6-methoxyphenol hydroxylase-like FAD-dependent oxidoreductase